MKRKAATEEKLTQSRLRTFVWCGHQAQAESEWPDCKFQYAEERKYDDGFVIVYKFTNIPKMETSQFQQHIERRLRRLVSGQGYVRHRIEVQVP